MKKVWLGGEGPSELGEQGTDALSRPRVEQLIAERGYSGKKAEDYVALIEQAELALGERGSASLRQWLERARVALGE